MEVFGDVAYAFTNLWVAQVWGGSDVGSGLFYEARGSSQLDAGGDQGPEVAKVSSGSAHRGATFFEGLSLPDMLIE